MGQGFFITGTDTDVGKTWATIALMRSLQNQGLTVLGMKPVAAGCAWQDGVLKNQDALLMQSHASVRQDYALINPYAFEKAISPHLACAETTIQPDVIEHSFKRLQAEADCLLVEGAGGWCSPLSSDLTNAQLAQYLDLPVILVVGLRLGCLNHADLTMQAIKHSGRTCAGWIGMVIDPVMQSLQANIDYLQNKMESPLLGVLPSLSYQDFEVLSNQIDPKKLKNVI